MRKTILTICISGLVYFCSAQIETEKNKVVTNTKQTEVIPFIEKNNNEMKTSRIKPLPTTVRTDDNKFMPAQQQPAEEKSAKPSVNNAKLNEE